MEEERKELQKLEAEITQESGRIEEMQIELGEAQARLKAAEPGPGQEPPKPCAQSITNIHAAALRNPTASTVSYTHLTLPTICSV